MKFDTFNGLKSNIAKTLKEVLYGDTQTPAGSTPIPCEIHVPFHSIRPDDDEPDTVTASVTYVVKCPSEKKHTVHVRFRIDSKGKYTPGSLSYV